MNKTMSQYITMFSACIVFLLLESNTMLFGMIEREYTIQEVLDAATNVVFGKVESVDKKRMRVIVKVEENLKGKSEFNRIKMNIAVGETRRKLTSPQMMIKKFNEGLPIAILYKKNRKRIETLGHVSGTWFQLFATDAPNKDKVWWNFTHIEAYMHRTYDGSTEEFQKNLRDALAGKKWPGAERDTIKVLVFTANSTKPILGQVALNSKEAARLTGTPEFLALRKFTKVGNRKIAYHATKDRQLPGLNEANILWIGQGEIAEGKYLLTKNTERKIKNFVRNGGVAIVTGQDSDENKPCPTEWIPEPMEGVERQFRKDFQTTSNAGNLFETPNKVRSGQPNIDDTWTKWSPKYIILATTNNGNDLAVATLKYGRGMYIVTGIQNETQKNVKANTPLMENLIYYAVNNLTLVN